jgi:hypothetical protein
MKMPFTTQSESGHRILTLARRAAGVLLLVVALLPVACAPNGADPEPAATGEPRPTPTTDPDSPVSSDDPTATPDNAPTPAGGFVHGEAMVESIDILILESFPVQVNVLVRGNLPDGCTEIDEALVDQQGNTFNVNLTTRRPAEIPCTEALVPFEHTVPLEVHGLPAGDYTVVVNGVEGVFNLAVDNVLPDETPAGAGEGMRQIFMIALEDNGASGPVIGCGDSLVGVSRDIPSSDDPIRTTLELLLAEKGQYYGESGLYNSLYQSSLSVESVVLDTTGKATVHLTGTYALGGVCDSPRFQAQLEETVRQFEQVTTVEIFLNGTPLEDLLSGAG